MKTTRRLFALLLVVCLLAGYAVVPAYAADAAATLSFDTTDNRVSVADDAQVWQANGITMTNAIGESQNPIKDYVNPVRLYKGTTVKIEYPGMTKLVFTCFGGEKYALKSADVEHLGTLTVDDLVMTLVLNEAADSIEFSAASNQVRLSKLEVYTGDVAGGGSEEPSEPEVTEPEVTEPEVVATVEAIADGTYVISTGAYTLAALAEDESYGYAPAGDASAPAETDVITITNVDGGFTMQDCYGRYLYMSGTYNSFSVGAEAPSEAHVWQLMNDGTNLYLVNVAKEKTLAYSTGYGTWGIYSSLKDTDLFALTVTAYAATEEPAVGTEENPLFPEFQWNEDQTEATATVKVPAKTTYHCAVYGAGMILTVNDGDEQLLTAQGMGRVPAYFTLVNDTDAAADFVLNLKYPEGNQMNPEELYMLGTQYTALEADDFDGYYYSYTADSACTLTFSFVNVTEGVEADIVVTNQNSMQKSLLGDGTDGVLTLEVAEGDVLTIQVVVLPAADWTYPEATIFWDVNLPVGTELNPLFPEFQWNETQTEATATVKVPANTTYYCATYNIGMLLTINDGEAQLLTAQGMGRVPAYFTLVNSTDAAADFVLNLKHPEGSQMNPEELFMLGTQYAALEANDFDGYYYSYTADGAATLKISLVNVTEGVEADIIVTNQDSVQKTLLEDGTDGVLTLEVAEGDVLTIQAVALPGADWTIPAATIFWDINYPAGTEMNPLFPEFQWNEDQTEATATVKVPAKTTYHCAVYGAGMILTVNDGDEQLLTAQGMGRVPAYFTLVNDTDAAADFVLNLKYPEGNQMNPEELYMLGTQYTALEADDFDGYYYSYTADSACTLNFSLVNVTEGVEADIIVTNQNSMQKSLLEDGTDGVLALEVAEGDVLTIQVVVLPAADWTYPEATIFWDVNLPAGTELNPLFPEFQWNEEWTEATATVKVPANTTYYCATYNIGMLLTINDGEAQLLTAQGMGRVPAYFTLVNSTDAAADFVLNLKHPEGSQMNPEKISKAGTLEVALEANDFDGYYYSIKAIADGSVEFSIDAITEGVEADIIVTNQDSVQKSLLEDGTDGVLTLEVAKGDVLTVQVVVMPDMMWNYPAANLSVGVKLDYNAIYGDVNGDGEIGILDLMRLANFFAGKEVEIDEANADVNGDGKVSILDLMRLANYFAGKDVQLGE